MMRKSGIYFLILVGAGVFMGGSSLLWAQPPAISINLTFDKDFYQFGEAVGVEVAVNSEEDLLISRGFSSKVYYLEMRVIDAAGRLLVARNLAEPKEMAAPPLLPYVRSGDQIVRVGQCENLTADWSKVSQTEDLRTYFPMELPGYYSAQVQLSVMTFGGQPCNVNDYKWLGVLKSETIYFYMQGRTKVYVVPNQWQLSWKGGKKSSDLQVQIWPEEGKTVQDYNAGSLRLNNVPAKKVNVLPPMLEAYFDSGEAVNSLGSIEVGQWYPVVISGRLKNGKPFGGGDEVKIIR